MSSSELNQFKQIFWKIRTNPYFENSVIFIIVVSAITVGASTFDGMEKWDAYLDPLDYFITVFFLVEIIIKLISEDKWWNFFKDGWNIFDFVIVVVSLIPLEGSELVLVGRLLRIFRVLRMITVIPELKILISSLGRAMASIGSIILLLFIIFYIYGAIGSFIFKDMKSGLWTDILTSMLTLFRVMTMEDWTDVMYETMEVHPWSWFYFVSFIFLSAFTFFNLFVGVIVTQVGEESDRAKAEENRKKEIAKKEAMEYLTQKVEAIEAQIKALTTARIESVETQTKPLHTEKIENIEAQMKQLTSVIEQALPQIANETSNNNLSDTKEKA